MLDVAIFVNLSTNSIPNIGLPRQPHFEREWELRIKYEEVAKSRVEVEQWSCKSLILSLTGLTGFTRLVESIGAGGFSRP